MEYVRLKTTDSLGRTWYKIRGGCWVRTKQEGTLMTRDEALADRWYLCQSELAKPEAEYVLEAA